MQRRMITGNMIVLEKWGQKKNQSVNEEWCSCRRAQNEGANSKNCKERGTQRNVESTDLDSAEENYVCGIKRFPIGQSF